MKRYFYFPTGRQLWFDLPERLATKGIAEPVLWIGDSALDRQAQERFPDAQILPFRSFTKTRRVPAADYDGAFSTFWNSDTHFRVKERAIKLMDRADPHEDFRNVDRDAFFNSLVAWGLDRLATLRPDFLLYSEAPHGTAPYVLYELAKFAGIPVYGFTSWPLMPVLSLRRDIDGPRLARPQSAKDAAFAQRFNSVVATYLQGFADPVNYGFEPRYMKRQRLRDPDMGLKQTLIRALRGPVAVLALLSRRKRVAAIRRHALRRAMNPLLATALPEKYVYFPLHYEPERTTNPDGGDFHDQMRTLAYLRSVIPADMQIVVKEHPSSFNVWMNGHLGRSPGFYDMIHKVKGVHIVPTSHSTAELILGSAFVVSITGTVALEAAILGRRALTFGNCWFEGCPGIHRYSDAFNYDDFIASSTAAPDEIQDWMAQTYAAFGLPGCINPSNERYFAKFYDGTNLNQLETDAVTDAVITAIS